MSSMCVGVEFLAGTTITNAVNEAKEKAILWDVSYVTFSFNGIAISVSQHSNTDDIEEHWHKLLTTKDTFWIVGVY